MKKKEFYTAIILSLFLVMGIQPALATKYIRADSTGGDAESIGTWDVGTLTCTLTQDVSETIQIMDDGITLDGDDIYSVTGPGTTGIDLTGRTNVTVINVTVDGFDTGISLGLASNCDIIGNTVLNSSTTGIFLSDSSNNNIMGNEISGASTAVGIQLQLISNGSNSNTLESNKISGNEIGIWISNSTGNTVTMNTVTDCSATGAEGIQISNSNSNILMSNNLSNNYWGIHVYLSSNVEIKGNTITGISGETSGGIWLQVSTDNSVKDNTVTGCSANGIYLASQNDFGSDRNTVTGNTFSNNGTGIRINPSNNNQVYNNNLIDNSLQISVSGTGNVFGGESTGGNHWSDYQGVDDGSEYPPGTPRIAGDGIGDTDLPHLGVDIYPYVNENGWLPAANAGENQTVECACKTAGGTQVTLDGSGSSGASTYTWTGSFLESPISGLNPTVTLDPGCLGDYEITLVINNGELETETDTVLITVLDTTAPDVIPPGDVTIGAMGPEPVPVDDERIQAFLAGVSANDNCDPEPDITNDAPAEFPPGDTVVTFTATDASGNESTKESTVTVMEAAESNLRIIPKIINREGRLEQILAVIRFPAGTTEEDINIETPLVLYPGESPIGIEATSQRVVTWCMWGTLRVAVFARFPKDDISAGVPEDGPAELMVIGQFSDGQYFYGFDNVWICSWSW